MKCTKPNLLLRILKEKKCSQKNEVEVYYRVLKSNIELATQEIISFLSNSNS